MKISDLHKDFPILNRKVFDNRLVYLDNAATSQKPKQVVDAITDFYFTHNANVHRGLHTLSDEATDMFEQARADIANFIGAHPGEVIFTKGATESLNRVAFGWAFANVRTGDKIVLTRAEHHSNLVPWQIVAKRIGAELGYIEVSTNGEIDLTQAKEVIDTRTKIVAISHASNTLGTIFPVKEIADIAHKQGAVVAVDGAQAAPHLKVNVYSLGCDFYAFSGHKMLGPVGVGVLWAKKEHLAHLEPYEYGGGMIEEVKYDSATWTDVPHRFEAGTPNVAGVVGLATAVKYLESVGMENIREHEIMLNTYALAELAKIPGLKVVGPIDPTNRTGLVAFYFDKIHSHDMAAILNTHGVAVRSGHHCTMPLHTKLGIPSTCRASWYLYNTKEDIDVLVKAIYKALEIL